MTEEDLTTLADTIPAAMSAIQGAQNIVLACHVNPDGDALGSMLALAQALIALGKSVTALSQDGVPDILQFLPGVALVQRTSPIAAFDLAIVLDSGDLSRVGPQVLPIVGRAPLVIDVDHHVNNGAFGDIRVLDSRAASTAEIVFALIETLQAPMTADIATCLFTGIITDTGSFRFQNVTPNTLRVAAALLEAGAPPATISENVFDNRTFAATQLLGLVLSSLSESADGRIVWAHVTSADFAATQATDAETEGFVNYARGVRGAEVGILFREVGDGTIRVSLRSRETVNVAEVAQQFGGGGHRMAAGCSLSLPLPDAEHAVLHAVCAALPPL